MRGLAVGEPLSLNTHIIETCLRSGDRKLQALTLKF